MLLLLQLLLVRLVLLGLVLLGMLMLLVMLLHLDPRPCSSKHPCHCRVAFCPRQKQLAIVSRHGPHSGGVLGVQRQYKRAKLLACGMVAACVCGVQLLLIQLHAHVACPLGGPRILHVCVTHTHAVRCMK